MAQNDHRETALLREEAPNDDHQGVDDGPSRAAAGDDGLAGAVEAAAAYTRVDRLSPWRKMSPHAALQPDANGPQLS